MSLNAPSIRKHYDETIRVLPCNIVLRGLVWSALGMCTILTYLIGHVVVSCLRRPMGLEHAS